MDLMIKSGRPFQKIRKRSRKDQSRGRILTRSCFDQSFRVHPSASHAISLFFLYVIIFSIWKNRFAECGRLRRRENLEKKTRKSWKVISENRQLRENAYFPKKNHEKSWIHNFFRFWISLSSWIRITNKKTKKRNGTKKLI